MEALIITHPHQQVLLTHRKGCWVRDTRSSTAKALAMYDMPGLDTVHCWSNVRSRVDCGENHSRHYYIKLHCNSLYGNVLIFSQQTMDDTFAHLLLRNS